MLTDEQFDALIGSPTKPPPPPGIIDASVIDDPARFIENQHANSLWFSMALGIDLDEIERRLVNCPVIGHHGDEKLYSIPHACTLIMLENVDQRRQLKGLRSDDLPRRMRKDFWLARLRKLKLEERHGHLWRTEFIRELVAEAFKNLNSAIQLVPDNVDKESELSKSEREQINTITDRMRDRAYRRLKDHRDTSSTPSVASEYEEGI